MEKWLEALRVGKQIAKDTTVVVVNDNRIEMAKKERKKTHFVKKDKKLGLEENKSSDTSDGKNVEKDYEVIDKPNTNGHLHTKAMSLVDGSDSMFTQQHVFNKDEILESISTILYKTQILGNDSPVTNSLVAIEAVASSIYKDLNGLILKDGDSKVSEEDQQKTLNNAVGSIGDMRIQIEKLVHTFEDIREKLYPIAEKIALIELQKNPYRIPGDPYRKVQLERKTVSFTVIKNTFCQFIPTIDA